MEVVLVGRISERPRSPREPVDPPLSPQPAGFAAYPTLVDTRVVIVEDEGITQMMLHRTLTRAGLRVVATASTGQQGAEAVLQERPDLVLMDIKMPGAIDGMEASRRILSEFRTCIVLLTANDDADYREKARALGACGYIVKPITMDILLPQLAAALERWRGRAS